MNSKNFLADLKSGIVVFLVALPLCLGIALACNAPLFSGILAGVIGGILVTSFSGSTLSVSGPAAGLTSIVLASVASLGSFPVFLAAVVCAGLLQIVLGIIKAGSIGNYIPNSVIKGMLAGIGIILIIKQFPHLVGYDKDPEGDFDFFQPDGHNTFSDLVYMVQAVSPGAITVGLVSIAVLLISDRPFYKNNRVLSMIPGPLLVVTVGILLSISFQGNANMAIAQEHMVSLPVIRDFNDLKSNLFFPDFSKILSGSFWMVVLTLAVVASLESLLSIEATDKLDPERRNSNSNKELIAQGLGNTAAGLIGALPVTAVIVRSSANINAGARTKLSTIIHGSLLLISVAFIPSLMNHIPLAALASILIVTGYKLCNPKVFKHMWKEGGRTQFIPFIVTVIAVVRIDLLKGVALGMVVSIFYILRHNMRVPYYYHRSSYSNGDLIKLTLAQEVSFLNKASINQTLDNLPENSSVIIDASQTEYIDFDVLDLIRDFTASQAPSKNIKVSLEGFMNTYKVPRVASEEELISELTNIDEVPKRSAGNYKKLLKQLTGRGRSPRPGI